MISECDEKCIKIAGRMSKRKRQARQQDHVWLRETPQPNATVVSGRLHCQLRDIELDPPCNCIWCSADNLMSHPIAIPIKC